MHERDMTADELESFEEEVVHDQSPASGSGPASEAETIRNEEEKLPGPVLPNPD
jgi:hypothetical protein